MRFNPKYNIVCILLTVCNKQELYTHFRRPDSDLAMPEHRIHQRLVFVCLISIKRFMSATVQHCAQSKLIRKKRGLGN